MNQINLKPTSRQLITIYALMRDFGKNLIQPDLQLLSRGTAGKWIRQSREYLVHLNLLPESVLKDSRRNRPKETKPLDVSKYMHLLAKNTVVKTITITIYANGSSDVAITNIGD